MAQHNELGVRGEQIAVDYLMQQGYTLLHRNWHAPHSRHELDIIALGENRLIVVEVKTRSSNDFGEPFDAVDRQKIKSIACATNSYVKCYNIDYPIRFDIIGITDDKVEHIKSAFLPPQFSR